MIRQLNRENASWPVMPVQIEKSQWPEEIFSGKNPPFAVWRSCEYLVQAFAEKYGIIRLSVNRTMLDPDTMRWRDGISWDELQMLKNWVGFSLCEAVEIYPPKEDEVDVANLRHLWVLPERLAFSWRKE